MPPDACLRRRKPAALKPPRFPILAFDERELRLALGSVFNLKWLVPGESLVSILWKFGCANALAADFLVQLIDPDIDPSVGVAPVREVVNLMRLRRLLRLPRTCCTHRCSTRRSLVATTPLSGIADSARHMATTVCCINSTMKTVVLRIGNRSKRDACTVGKRRPTSSTPASSKHRSDASRATRTSATGAFRYFRQPRQCAGGTALPSVIDCVFARTKIWTSLVLSNVHRRRLTTYAP